MLDKIFELQDLLLREDSGAYYQEFRYNSDCERLQILKLAKIKVKKEDNPIEHNYLCHTSPDATKHMMEKLGM